MVSQIKLEYNGDKVIFHKYPFHLTLAFHFFFKILKKIDSVSIVFITITITSCFLLD